MRKGAILFLVSVGLSAFMPAAAKDNDARLLFTVELSEGSDWTLERAGMDSAQWRIGPWTVDEGPMLPDTPFPVLIAAESLIEQMEAQPELSVSIHGSAGGYRQLLARVSATGKRDGAVTNGYHDQDEVAALLEQFETEYPSIARRIEIGRTHGNRPIFALKISDHVSVAEPETAVVVDGGIHPYEFPPPEICLDMIDQLLTQYGSDPDITSWVDGLEIYVIPCLNPDGRWICEEINSGWRKNGRDNDANGIITDADGVDLNRNFPFEWDGPGSSPVPGAGTYRGPWPASEPETQSMMALLKQVRPAFHLTLHSYGGFMICPYSCGAEQPDPHPMVWIGRQIASAATNEDGGTMGLAVGAPGFEHYNGTFPDWCFSALGTFSYGVEAGQSGVQPLYEITRDQIVPGFRGAWRRMLSAALETHPGLCGQILDAATGTPVPVRITISTNEMSAPQGEHWQTRSDGWFNCLLPTSGLWRVVFEPAGRPDLTSTQTVLAGAVQIETNLSVAYRPQIHAFDFSGQTVTAAWTSQFSEGRTLLETAESLTQPWLPLQTVVSTGQSAAVDFTTSSSQAFYRVVGVDAAQWPVWQAAVPAGSFRRGDASGSFDANEQPAHRVWTPGFLMERTEITKSLWDDIRGYAATIGFTDLPAGFAAASNDPITQVSWYDCLKWCNALSIADGFQPVYYTNQHATMVYQTGMPPVSNLTVNRAADGYRLPTEAEWEKAARGGFTDRLYPNGNTLSGADANWLNSGDSWDNAVAPAGSFTANGWGLYDLSGNAAEWCWDGFGAYTAEPQTDPHGAKDVSERVVRGGSWGSSTNPLRCSAREAALPTHRTDRIGFRCIRRPQ